MNRLISLLTLLLLVSYSFSQEHDARLLDRYTEAELTSMKKNNSKEYTFLVKALDQATRIGNIPSEKEVSFDGVLNHDPNLDHTFISLGLTIQENNYQYFKFEGTNKMVVVRPKSLIK